MFLREFALEEQKRVLEEFDKIIQKGLESKKLVKLEEDIFIFPLNSERKIAFIAGSHGNEPIGVKILSSVLEDIFSGKFKLLHGFVFILGNREAYKKNIRFTEEDLNRQFHLKSSSHEGKRAKIISKLLDTCDVCIDIHQTVEKTARPFWLFPFSKERAYFASYLAKDLSAVTHDFKGLVSTISSYMASKNKVGLTLEVSDSGFSKEAVALGREVIQKALVYEPSLRKESFPELFEVTFYKKFPGGSKVSWKEGVENFKFAKKGETLGDVDGLKFKAESSGFIFLYPSVMFLQNPQPEGLYVICSEKS